MRKLVLLVGLCMLGVLAFAAAAGAQQSGGDVVYDPNTGRYIGEGEAVALYGRNPDGSIDIPTATATPTATAQPTVTSEEWRADQIAAAVESGQMTQAEACAEPAYAAVYPDACGDVQTAPVEPLTAAPTATATADATGGTAALPETGGLSVLSLAALGMLTAGGILSARLVRR